MLGRLGPGEELLIAAVALLVIGPRKLPEFARSVGRSLTEFRRGLKAGGEEAGDGMASPESSQDVPAKPK